MFGRILGPPVEWWDARAVKQFLGASEVPDRAQNKFPASAFVHGEHKWRRHEVEAWARERHLPDPQQVLGARLGPMWRTFAAAVEEAAAAHDCQYQHGFGVKRVNVVHLHEHLVIAVNGPSLRVATYSHGVLIDAMNFPIELTVDALAIRDGEISQDAATFARAQLARWRQAIVERVGATQ
jgi:hypothetical protein